MVLPATLLLFKRLETSSAICSSFSSIKISLDKFSLKVRSAAKLLRMRLGLTSLLCMPLTM